MEASAAAAASSSSWTALYERLDKRSIATNTSGLATFSHRLTKQLSAANYGAGNLVFSPLSIHSGLTLVALGSRGDTLSEILDALGEKTRDGLAENVHGMVESAFPENPRPGGPRVAYASALWHEATRTLKPTYRDAAAASCRTFVRAVDFMSKPKQAAKEINSWVATATNKLIDSIVGPGSVNKDTRLVVTNAVYFKGKWETPFHKSNTREHKFHRVDGSAVDAMFMSSSRKQFIAIHDGFKVLRMPYKMRDDISTGLRDAAMAVPPPRPMPTPTPLYSMCVFLPDARDGLRSLEDRMASSPSFVRDHMPERRVEVGEFRVPKFRLEFSGSIMRALQNLGITSVFTRRAELPDMLAEDAARGEPLFVSDVLHKAVIEVNEEGTEAAACTAYVMASSCPQPAPRPVPVDFVADHPFAFFVVEEGSGAILFAGHVLDPTKS